MNDCICPESLLAIMNVRSIEWLGKEKKVVIIVFSTRKGERKHRLYTREGVLGGKGWRNERIFTFLLMQCVIWTQ